MAQGVRMRAFMNACEEDFSKWAVVLVQVARVCPSSCFALLKACCQHLRTISSSFLVEADRSCRTGLTLSRPESHIQQCRACSNSRLAECCQRFCPLGQPTAQ
eukprot:1841183-Amphidinium_carterae.1